MGAKGGAPCVLTAATGGSHPRLLPGLPGPLWALLPGRSLASSASLPACQAPCSPRAWVSRSSGAPAPTSSAACCFPAPSTAGGGTHSVGGSPVTGRQLTNHAPGTEGRREWVCPLHASPAQVLRRRTRGSVAGKHPINVQTSSYTHWALLRPWESWSESSVFPTAGH